MKIKATSYKKPLIKEYISKLRYHEDYWIKKTIISSIIYLPRINKKLKYSFHIGKLINWNDEHILRKFYAELEGKEYSKEEETTEELTPESKKYCPDPIKQKVYFFTKVKEGKNKIPDYYGLLCVDDFLYEEDQDKIETNKHISIALRNKTISQIRYLEEIEKYLQRLIFSNLLYVTTLNNWKLISEFAAEIIYEYLFEKKTYVNAEKLNGLRRSISKIDDPALLHYFQSIYDSFHNEVNKKNLIAHCKKCKAVIRKNTLYCSKKCAKSVQNRRNYKRRKAKTTK